MSDLQALASNLVSVCEAFASVLCHTQLQKALIVLCVVVKLYVQVKGMSASNIASVSSIASASKIARASKSLVRAILLTRSLRLGYAKLVR